MQQLPPLDGGAGYPNLIITEAAAISKQGYGWAGAPGMYSDEQQVSSVSVHHFILHYAACCCITESDGE